MLRVQLGITWLIFNALLLTANISLSLKIISEFFV